MRGAGAAGFWHLFEPELLSIKTWSRSYYKNKHRSQSRSRKIYMRPLYQLLEDKNHKENVDLLQCKGALNKCDKFVGFYVLNLRNLVFLYIYI